MKFAVFDIDGTLIRWQLYHTLVDKLAKQGVLGEGTLDRLRAARMRWKKRESSEEFKVYELALVRIYEDGLKQIPTNVFDNLVQEVIEEYKDQVYTYTRDLLAKLKAENYFLIAISGSHEELVAKVADYYGFDKYTGSHYERSGETFTGKTMVATHNKKSILEEYIQKYKLELKGSYGIGDSLSDAAILEIVENPIAFNPNKELFALAEKNGWDVVIERKNMIYRLKERNGTFILAETN